MIGKLFLDHPRSVGESYGEHMVFALGFAATLMVAGLAALVHAFMPCVFARTASRIVAQAYQRTKGRGAR